VQHSISRQQRRTQSNSVWNPRVLGYQKYKLDRPLTQALAELPTSGFLANAFVNDHPFNAVHERTRGSLRRRSVVQHTTLAIKLHRCFRRYDIASLGAFTGRALMIFRAGLALNIVGSFVNGLMPLRSFVAGFLMTTNLAKSRNKEGSCFLEFFVAYLRERLDDSLDILPRHGVRMRLSDFLNELRLRH
jgi:hypothetical protein